MIPLYSAGVPPASTTTSTSTIFLLHGMTPEEAEKLSYAETTIGSELLVFLNVSSDVSAKGLEVDENFLPAVEQSLAGGLSSQPNWLIDPLDVFAQDFYAPIVLVIH